MLIITYVILFLFHCTVLKTKSALKMTNGTPAKKHVNDIEANSPLNRSVGSQVANADFAFVRIVPFLLKMPTHGL